MYIHIKNFRLYPLAIVLTSIISSLYSPVYADEMPHEQTFVVTAYYSPKPDQCCYFRGNYDEEIAFNGRGTNGADGTEVYPGMIAAPPTYPFGTVIALPGIGVGTVHDRGGRITEWGDDIHRIDLWMGEGEEGLARALAWGVRKVKGTVYPSGDPTAPREHLALEQFNADSSVLASLPASDPTLLVASVKYGDREYAVRLLQHSLTDLGYFRVTPNGQFGPATQRALASFLKDYALPGDGSAVDEHIAAALTAATTIKPDNLPDVPIGLARGRTGGDVRQAQKLLRFLGYYRGRTDGVYSRAVQRSVLALQTSQGLIRSNTDTGAGRIGPGTRDAILKLWKAKIVALKTPSVALKMDIAARVRSEKFPARVLAAGDSGSAVRLLQRHLKDLGYLSAESVTGTFGGRTRSALLTYQKDRKIVTADTAKGAGVFGPSTRSHLVTDIVERTWQRVRADGIGAL